MLDSSIRPYIIRFHKDLVISVFRIFRIGFNNNNNIAPVVTLAEDSSLSIKVFYSAIVINFPRDKTVVPLVRGRMLRVLGTNIKIISKLQNRVTDNSLLTYRWTIRLLYINCSETYRVPVSPASKPLI